MKKLSFFLLLSLLSTSAFGLFLDPDLAYSTHDEGYRVIIKKDGSYELVLKMSFPEHYSLEEIFLEGFLNGALLSEMDQKVKSQEVNGEKKLRRVPRGDFKLIQTVEWHGFSKNLTFDCKFTSRPNQMRQDCELDLGGLSNFVLRKIFDYYKFSFVCKRGNSGENFCQVITKGKSKDFPFKKDKTAERLAISGNRLLIYNMLLMNRLFKNENFDVAKGRESLEQCSFFDEGFNKVFDRIGSYLDSNNHLKTQIVIEEVDFKEE